MKIVYPLLMFVLVLSIVGCTPKPTPPPGPPPTVRTPAPPPTPGAAATLVNVELGEWFVKLNPTSAPAGNITFALKNVGKYEHALRIEGYGVDKSSKNLKAGGTETMTINLKPGTYEADCPIDGHEARGMKTTFTVTAPTAAAPGAKGPTR